MDQNNATGRVMRHRRCFPSFLCINNFVFRFTWKDALKTHGLSVLARRSRQNVNCGFLFKQSYIIKTCILTLYRLGGARQKKHLGCYFCHKSICHTPTVAYHNINPRIPLERAHYSVLNDVCIAVAIIHIAIHYF